MCEIDTITEASGAEITVCQPHHASDITNVDELKDQRSSVIVFIISCSRSLPRLFLLLLRHSAGPADDSSQTTSPTSLSVRSSLQTS
ncbi:hypothetical protein PGT21_010617 [Puccinia graminis f. sp. tritici]|uniref:Uncharacterized protein n=1 Tax=Puccinia graminis f. sp. tritici TaxID=56615 RepID=A0A5B0P243_PUCGR|nr:hypothetical protein PGTUg99_031745 [Puccinia graminis f. sp. tritici]KAA1094129.1 hypothetical protein PGT21_010617 [Puccinia graminis f. sp. tritici]